MTVVEKRQVSHNASSPGDIMAKNSLDGEGTLSQQVYRLLRDLIIRLTLLPNQVLSEKDVAGTLAISKTPVREAFIRLAEEGMVRIVPKSGTYVSTISRQRAAEGYFIWNALESSSAGHVAEALPLGYISRLRDIVDKQKLCLTRNDPDGFTAENRRFHQEILAMADFPGVGKIMDIAKFEVERLRSLDCFQDPCQPEDVIAEHLDIVNAMAKRDSDATRISMSRHLSWIKKAASCLGDGDGLDDRIRSLNTIYRRRFVARADEERHNNPECEPDASYDTIAPPELLQERPVGEVVGAVGLRNEGGVTQQICTLLRKPIVNLHLMPNQFLSENEVADCLHVSKTPVREAFIRLADDGLLTVVPKKGTFVAPIDIKRVFEGFFIRISLESACAEQIARDGTDEDIRALEKVLETQSKRLRLKDYNAFYVLDNHFHGATFAVAGLPNTRRLVEVAKSEVDRIKSLKSVYRVCRSEEELYEEHRMIYKAIASRDVMKARVAIKSHLTGMNEAIQAIALDENLWRFVNTVNQVSINSRSLSQPSEQCCSPRPGIVNQRV